ncbi:hypothetical protein CLOM_g13466 [Closterium sp. NIES-68]|nr:hypothetical protein CLOM_g13466 [Closterium sp. NIES-68]GJP59709.1 hypothetical protein CLOP_g15085 [Closterium sp. NIES-67]
MAATVRELQQQLEAEVNALRSMEKDITRNHKVRRQYTLQLNENEMVQKELDLLEEDAKVFKLIGPVLVPQDLAEAKANVAKRLEYISSEVKRLEGALKQLEQKQGLKQQDIMQAQRKLQAFHAQRRQ